jgi:hypothetical protein
MGKKTTSKDVAIRATLRQGHILAQEHPEVFEKWKNGLSQRQLAEIYLPHVDSEHGRRAVLQAIKELASDQERRNIRHDCLVANGMKRGMECAKRKKGIFALNKTRLEEIGIIGRRASMLARGVVPYDGIKKFTEFGKEMTEAEYIEAVVKAFCAKKGRFDWVTVTRLVNAVFQNNRKQGALRQFGKRFEQ